jgi:hypothetical protein
MYTALSTTYPVAQKNYQCVACEAWLDSGYTLDDCETEEQKEIVKKAESDGWKILKGEKHIKQSGVDFGVFYTTRAKIDMDKIVLALDLYPEF